MFLHSLSFFLTSTDLIKDTKAIHLFVRILPIAGFMLYFLFYSRKLRKKFIRRLEELKKLGMEVTPFSRLHGQADSEFYVSAHTDTAPNKGRMACLLLRQGGGDFRAFR
ncbi:MAG: hypothetical protein IKJ35_07015 [Clostridia bacterium]|nr:hypothetical protein [Clostridia bacterium]